MAFGRDLAVMSARQWALLCGCAFVVAMGAGLGVFTPQQQLGSQPTSSNTPYKVIRGGQEDTRSAQVPLVIRGGSEGAQSASAHLPSFRTCARSAAPCVVDGDTFRFNGETIRIADIDAPETGGAKCAEEAALGQRATQKLAELLSSRSFQLEAVGKRDVDMYGRKLRIVISGGRSIGATLVDEGLARPWTGRRRPWC